MLIKKDYKIEDLEIVLDDINSRMAKHFQDKLIDHMKENKDGNKLGGTWEHVADKVNFENDPTRIKNESLSKLI